MRNVVVTAYIPITGGMVSSDPVISRISDRLDATPAQVARAWLLHEGLAAIPSSTRPTHLRQNLDASSLVLSAADIQDIRALDRGERIIDPPHMVVWD